MGTKDFYSNFCIVIYIVLWMTVFYKQKRKNNFGTSGYLSFLYLVWAVVSLFLYNNDLRNSYGHLSLFPFLYLFFMIILFMRANIKYDNAKIKMIQCPSKLVLYCFFIVYGLCSLIALPIIINQLISNLQLILYNPSAGDVLYQINMKNATSGNGIAGLLGYAALIRNFFRECFIFLLFYYLTQKRRSHSLTIYLIIILILDIFSALASGGRTSFTMILFAVGAAYFIFRDYWEMKLRRLVKLLITIAGVCFLFVFIVLTISRFSMNNYSSSPLWSILSYLGQSPLNFNQYGLDAGGIRHGDRTLNAFKSLLGMNPPADFFAVRSKYSFMKMNDSCFYTFVGDFTLDFGPVVALIIFVFYSFMMTKSIRCNADSICFHRLLIVYFSACVCSQGSMYLFYYSYVQNWTIIAFLFMYIVFFIDFNLHARMHRYIYKNNDE